MDIDTNFICYQATNTTNGKTYVGQTSLRLEDRWNKHLQNARRGSPYALHRAIRKYGVESFVVQVIEHASSFDAVCLLEQKYITRLNSHTTGNGYNMTAGGDGVVGYTFTKGDKLKMSLAQQGKKRGPRSEKDKQKISEAHKRNSHGPSKHCNQRRSETGTGVPRPDEVKERIRASLKGRPRPPEVIEKIRATKRLKGESKSTST
jgi:group I intron endonuclease